MMRNEAGINFYGYQSYAEDKKYVVVKKIDGEWYFEGAGNDMRWAERAYEDCLRYADRAEIIERT